MAGETTRAATLARLAHSGVVAVVRASRGDATRRAVDALVAGGIEAIEITMTVPDAIEVTGKVVADVGKSVLVGVGTLRDPEDAKRATEAGASFLVSPHTDAQLSTAMTRTGVATCTGALTPTEVARARELGSDIVKLFPGSLGGPRYLASLREPFPDVAFMPTGGVDSENLAAWFDAGAMAVGAGGSLCPPDAIDAENWSRIEANARRFADRWREIRAHESA